MSRFHEFTLAEAMEVAKRNDPGKDVPSVSRVLLAHVDALAERAKEMEAQRDDYLSREWIATKARMIAEKRSSEMRVAATAYRDSLQALADDGMPGSYFRHQEAARALDAAIAAEQGKGEG